MSYPDYIKFMEEHLTEREVRRSADMVKPVGMFKKNGLGWESKYYPGYTMITPVSSSDLSHARLYDALVKAIAELTECLDQSKCMPAPATALHMTVARLVSDGPFKENILGKREQELLGVLDDRSRAFVSEGPLRFQAIGVSILPSGVIAASVSPAGEEDYRRLQHFRDYIYGDEMLASYGVDRKRGFRGHVTLYYLEGALSGEERKAVADCLVGLNARYFSGPLPFTLATTEVRQFESFLEFYRKDGWPVFTF